MDARPFLRWAGSKRSLLPELKSRVPIGFNRYVEPFAGSACLFFSLNPEQALLSDVNAELMDVYRAVRDYPEEIASELSSMPVSREHFYGLRAQTASDLRPQDRAVRFIYLNRFCFNGLYRTNMKGEFNVPFGAPKTPNVPTSVQLQECSKRLKKATLLSGDFESTVVPMLSKGDFVYLDPPYSNRGVRIFREYDPRSFKETDLPRFASMLDKIDEAGSQFLVSYADSDGNRTFFKKWRQDVVTTQRNISGFTKHRRLAQELVITNF